MGRFETSAGSSRPPRTLIRNAAIVLEDEIRTGAIRIEGETILADEDAAGAEDGPVIDFGGDFLIPGLIDLHTDNIEHHFYPRPGVAWPSALSAVLAHDWQVLGAGVTTVLDALSLGDYSSQGSRATMLRRAIDTIARARSSGLLRADHFFHFRCELSDPLLMEIVEPYFDHAMLRLVSLMDHTPGQRQWRDLSIYRRYRREKKGIVWTDQEFEIYLERCRETQRDCVPRFRDAIGGNARARGLPLASHDDTTIEDVRQSRDGGITISEFPTTLEAAREARAAGMRIVMGSPNIVLGGSHSGNVGAADLAAEGLLDILTSDYVPSSLLQAPFLLAARGIPLPAAMALVTAGPADALGFADRGRIAPGLRADLLRVAMVEDMPVVRGIWVAGRRYL